MRRAKVIFTDGWSVSPVIETDDKDLQQRIKRALVRETPSEAATAFVLVTAATKRKVALFNAPEGRSFGVTLSMLEHREFWPAAGQQAGVFLAWVTTGLVWFWGGVGFEDSKEFTAAITQKRQVGEERDED